MNTQADTKDTVIEQITNVVNLLEVKDKNKKAKLSEDEKKFREKADKSFKLAAFIFSTLVTTSPMFCPPLAYVAIVALLLASIIHYYDVKNDYKASHFIDKLFKKCKKKFEKFSKKEDNADANEIEFENLNNKVKDLVVANQSAQLANTNPEKGNNYVAPKKDKKYYNFATNVSTFFNSHSKKDKLSRASEIYQFCRKLQK